MTLLTRTTLWMKKMSEACPFESTCLRPCRTVLLRCLPSPNEGCGARARPRSRWTRFCDVCTCDFGFWLLGSTACSCDETWSVRVSFVYTYCVLYALYIASPVFTIHRPTDRRAQRGEEKIRLALPDRPTLPIAPRGRAPTRPFRPTDRRAQRGEENLRIGLPDRPTLFQALLARI